MGEVLGGLTPQPIWNYFEEICKYPRPSKNEKKVVEYVIGWAEEHNFDYQRDKVGNIVIRMPATPGMENRETIILQGHLDMVCEKNNDVEFDFDNDPIQAYIDGEWVTAKGTTLGADNGIAVAAAMAVATSENIPHGPLELLFTLDEETGLTGASGLEPGMMTGKLLLNLDSEEDGAIYIGCAGGIDTRAKLSFVNEPMPQGFDALKIDVKGLKGGHSGLDIHTGRGNAIKILGRLLHELYGEFEVRTASIEGGSKRNAIPRESHAVIAVDAKHTDAVMKEIESFNEIVKAEFATPEPDLQVTASKTDAPGSVIDANANKNMILMLQGLPHGVYRMNADIEGLVQISTNLATITTEDGIINIGTSQRSPVRSEIEDIVSTVGSVFKLAGAAVTTGDGYPGWKPNVNSKAVQLIKSTFNSLYNKDPEVKAIHAGLECGIISEKYPEIEMVSFGPTIEGAHSPDERINIETVGRFWDLLVEALKNAPEKK